MFKWNDGTNYLMHHGIPGQKWGVRNGPPYPLDRKASHRSKSSITYEKKVVPVKRGTVWSKEELDAFNENYSGLLPPKKDSKSSAIQDALACNPHMDEKGYMNNCIECSMAFELRRRGYDIVAGFEEESCSSHLFQQVFDVDMDDYSIWSIKQNPLAKERGFEQFKKEYLRRSEKALANGRKLDMNTILIEYMAKKQPPGSRGIIAGVYDTNVMLADGSLSTGIGGHVTTWEKIGNTFIIYEPQESGTTIVRNLNSFIANKDKSSVCICRLDDKRVLPEGLKKFIEDENLRVNR